MSNEQRMLQAQHANYIVAEYAGHNDSGEHPLGNQIIVKVDTVSEKVGKAGLLLAPEKVAETNSRAVTTGVIIAMGESAFTLSNDHITPWRGRKPTVGDRVTFKRYEGEPFQNGAPFQYMPDTAVRGIHFKPEEDKQ